MGGIYVTGRETDGTNYLGISTDLQLPSSIDTDTSKDTFPEFVLGFYDGKYGVDIGLKYMGGRKYNLFYWSSGERDKYDKEKVIWSTCDPQGDIGGSIYFDPGEKITMRAYLENNYVILKVQGQEIKARLNSNALYALKNGCQIKRQLVIASNRKTGQNYIPCDIYFYGATFYNGTVTTNRWKYEAFAPSNTHVFFTEEPDLSKGYVHVDLRDISIDGQCGYEKRNGEKFCYETGKIDLRGPNQF